MKNSLALAERIKQHRRTKEILIMSHTVVGYPTLETSYQLVDALVAAGVELIEIQFPFSEPIADGPVLLKANQTAVMHSITTDACFEFARTVTQKYPNTIFVIMTYYNIVYKRGVDAFLKAAEEAGISGIIVPDMLPEEAAQYQTLFTKTNVTPFFLVTPKTTPERMQWIIKQSRGMLYCVARVGVTGAQTLFTPAFYAYLSHVNKLARVPVGVGFGIRTKEDVDNLKGRADIAIICTKAIELCVAEGPEAVGHYFKSLRS